MYIQLYNQKINYCLQVSLLCLLCVRRLGFFFSSHFPLLLYPLFVSHIWPIRSTTHSFAIVLWITEEHDGVVMMRGLYKSKLRLTAIYTSYPHSQLSRAATFFGSSFLKKNCYSIAFCSKGYAEISHWIFIKLSSTKTNQIEITLFPSIFFLVMMESF